MAVDKDKDISTRGADARTDPIASHKEVVISEVALLQGEYGECKVHKAQVGITHTWVGTRANGVARNYGTRAKAVEFALSDPNPTLEGKQREELRNVRKHVQARYERQTFLT